MLAGFLSAVNPSLFEASRGKFTFLAKEGTVIIIITLVITYCLLCTVRIVR